MGSKDRSRVDDDSVQTSLDAGQHDFLGLSLGKVIAQSRILQVEWESLVRGPFWIIGDPHRGYRANVQQPPDTVLQAGLHDMTRAIHIDLPLPVGITSPVAEAGGRVYHP